MAEKGFSTIILAAGQGTRMVSPLPKVLHPVAGFPMIYRIVKTAQKAGATEVRVVVGFGENLVRQVVEPLGAICHKQVEQRGTADAVRSAKPETLKGTVVILNGDHPLITSEDIAKFANDFEKQDAELAVITCELPEPGSYGRIVRHHGQLHSIVEAKDASADTLKIKEINTGIYVVRAKVLEEYLGKITANNAQKEFYLPDIVTLCREDRLKVIAISGPKRVSMGVNNQQELSRASRVIFKRKIDELMNQGVVVIDPKSSFVEDEVEIGQATVLYPGVFVKGKTRIGKFCVLEPQVFISNCLIEDAVQIKAGTYMQEAIVRSKAQVGPYAHLRPETEIGPECKVGNFVEMKKVKFGARAKASHLTYLGDADVGEDTNIGCGTITCNYAVDHKKYKTKIGKNVFVGSDTQFVAPVEIGDGSYVASGSTITKNVPAGSLAIARGKQRNIENYRPKSEGDSNSKNEPSSEDHGENTSRKNAN